MGERGEIIRVGDLTFPDPDNAAEDGLPITGEVLTYKNRPSDWLELLRQLAQVVPEAEDERCRWCHNRTAGPGAQPHKSSCAWDCAVAFLMMANKTRCRCGSSLMPYAEVKRHPEPGQQPIHTWTLNCQSMSCGITYDLSSPFGEAPRAHVPEDATVERVELAIEPGSTTAVVDWRVP